LHGSASQIHIYESRSRCGADGDQIRTGAEEAARGVHEGVYIGISVGVATSGRITTWRQAAAVGGFWAVGNDTGNSLDALPATSVAVTFDLYILATWDGKHHVRA
jgi:hypothetical protein